VRAGCEYGWSVGRRSIGTAVVHVDAIHCGHEACEVRGRVHMRARARAGVLILVHGERRCDAVKAVIVRRQ